MVEGGASVIGSFLAEASSSHNTKSDIRRSVVDIVIVTVAPTLVGDDGIGYGIGLAREHVGHISRWNWGWFVDYSFLFPQIPKLQHIRTEVIGQDTVIAARLGL